MNGLCLGMMSHWLWPQPMVSLLGGERLADGASVDTRDAFGAINGAQLLATEDEAERLVAHAAYFRPPPADLRAAVRRAEERMRRA